jgi:ElaB/YqjD/DUF883 family membrane-anchored ribosome-binding protein
MTPVVEAAREAADLSHEFQRLRSLAADVVDDGVHVAKRTMKSVKRGVEQLEDLKDEAVHTMKRRPLTAVGIALGVGLVLGAALGWAARRPSRSESPRP